MAQPTAPAPDIDRALARAEAYRVLATMFMDPDAPDAMEQLALSSLRTSARELGVHIGEQAWHILRRSTRRPARAAEHRAIFGHVVAHGCPLYETEYDRTHLFGQSQVLGDIRGFYEAFGVRPRRGGERPDHVACELEFLSLLSLKEAIALAQADEQHRTVCRAAATAFIEDHVGRWLPALAGRIESRAPATCYATAAALAAAFVAHHSAELGATPRALDPDDVIPTVGEPDGFSFECGLDAAGGDLTPPGS